MGVNYERFVDMEKIDGACRHVHGVAVRFGTQRERATTESNKGL